MIEKINIAIGDIFAKTLFGRRKKEPHPHQKPDLKIDPFVESLEFDQVAQLLPHVMTLARRRSCASEQIGQVNFAHESNIASLLANWYQLQGWKDTDLPQVMQNDLAALFNPTPNPTTALQQRILLSNIGLQAGDAYGYGQINPFLFQGNTQEVSFADTLAASLDFPTRVQTIISFDKEPRGHETPNTLFQSSAISICSCRQFRKSKNSQRPNPNTIKRQAIFCHKLDNLRPESENFGYQPSHTHPRQQFIILASKSPGVRLPL